MRKSLELPDAECVRTVLGAGDCHLRRIRMALELDIVARRNRVQLSGPADAVELGLRVFGELRLLAQRGQVIEARDVTRILQLLEEGAAPMKTHSGSSGYPSADSQHSTFNPPSSASFDAPTHAHGKSRDRHGHNMHAPTPRAVGDIFANSPQYGPSQELVSGKVQAVTVGQQKYVDAIRNHDIVFAIGPAGSGKTYLAVAMAIEALAQRLVNRLVLVRPAVEAGEHLGFLPGDLREKVNPYLRPLYDALQDLLSPAQVARFIERGVIEVAPLAFMRGRTLNNAFVILDEAQNTTPKQMKMFLTRLGRHARAVITGDVTQVDLPDGDLSGLAHSRDVLKDVNGVAFVHLEKQDIVRHPLVQRIVDAYDEREKLPLLDRVK